MLPSKSFVVSKRFWVNALALVAANIGVATGTFSLDLASADPWVDQLATNLAAIAPGLLNLWLLFKASNHRVTV